MASGIYKGIDDYLKQPGRAPGPVLTIGNFDGVHLGHQELIRVLHDKAKQFCTESIAMTFRPHPQNALHPEKSVPLLLEYDEKLKKLSSMGIGQIIEEPFSREFSTQPPEVFFENLMVRQLGIRALIVGYDFGFGKGREGGLDFLRSMCRRYSIDLTVVEAVKKNNEIVSSSLIRKYLSGGHLKEAAQLLGYPFAYAGVVTKGEQRGRRIGFPTANVKLDSGPGRQIVLPFGVYATRIHFWSKTFNSVTNIGIRPTFEAEKPPVLIETYVLDQSLDLYGVEVRIEFEKFLRTEKKFAGAKELTDQIQKDVREAARILQSTP